MKINHIIVLLIILVFVAQPVSAGFFEDLFNKITGRVTENITIEPTCTDSDGGLNYYEFGICTKTTPNGTVQTHEDGCDGGHLHERYCQQDGCASKAPAYLCPNGCKDGACIEQSTDTCVDSDGGIDYYVYGEVFTQGNTVPSVIDTCSGNTLYEGYCIGQGASAEPYTCQNGCQDGACLQNQTITNITCNLDSDCGTSFPLGGYFCEQNDVRRFYNNFRCINTGTPSSYCINSSVIVLVDDCTGNEYCTHGVSTCQTNETNATCTDSDESSHYFESPSIPLTPDNYPELFEKGYAEGLGYMYGEGSNIIKKYDYCGGAPDIEGFDTDPEKWLSEMMCDENGNVNNYAVECPNGCLDGACIGEPIHVAQREPLKIVSPDPYTVIDKPTEVTFTITNILEETFICESREEPPMNRISLELSYENHSYVIWETDDNPIVLQPGESITKTVTVNLERWYEKGEAELVMHHHTLTSYRIEMGEKHFDVGVFGSTRRRVEIAEPTLPPNVSSKTSPLFVLAVWDRAPTSDVALMVDVAQDLQDAGYGVGAIKLFSEINALTDNRVIVALYDNKAVIIVREDALSSHLTFSTELKSILNQNGVTSIRDLLGSDLESSNLADLFGITPVPPRGVGTEIIECERSVPPEAHENCELEGGDFVIRRDDEGCIRFVECVRRGQIDIVDEEEIEEVPPVANLLSIALKLETLKIEFDKMIRKLRGVVNYYEDIGNTAEAEKFRKVLGLFSNAKDKIEEIKARLRERVGFTTPDDLRDIKHDIKYISEVVMQDALYIILGGEIEIEGSKGVTEEGYIDCGDDSKCLDEALRLCEPAVLGPSEGMSPEDTFVKIKGLKKEVCILEITYQGDDAVCKIKDYATLRSENRDLMQYCKFKGLKVLKMFTATITTSADWTQSDCERMTDSNKKESCNRAVAINSKDVSFCEKITGDQEIGRCYFNMALGSNDFSICPKIPTSSSWYNGCYYQAAKRTKNTSYCEKITDDGERQACYVTVTNDISHCEKATDSDGKEKCYLNIAISTHDISLCEKITSTNNIRNCYINIAMQTKDTSLCEKMTDSDGKGSCYSAVAMETNDISLCEKITTNDIKYCYLNVAIRAKDSSHCEKITEDDSMRDECYAEIGDVS